MNIKLESLFAALLTCLICLTSGYNSAAQSPDVADLIITGGKIFTCDSQMKIADAIPL
jgi:hypothetical protein